MKVTWRELVRREPRLRSVYYFARDYVKPTDRPFCRWFLWQVVIEPQIGRLVGWSPWRHDVAVTTIEKVEAYRAAYNRIWKSLPKCDHDGPCGCTEPVL